MTSSRWQLPIPWPTISPRLALIANVVDPEMFLIGGGASASADVYLDKVREHFKQYALSASRETPIKVASLGNDAASSVPLT